MKYIFVLIIILAGCKVEKKSNLFFPAEERAKVSKKLREASGLAASIDNPGYLWTINDSGNKATVFLIDSNGQIALTRDLKVDNRDWEDIAIGPGPEKGQSYVYVADIGDNNSHYDKKFIYRFREPSLGEGAKKDAIDCDTIILKFPDKKRDAEALMIDPLTLDLFIISKREDSVVIYKTPQPFSKGTIVMKKVCKIPYNLIVAASVSADGSEILLKNYANIFYWKRETGESLDQTLRRSPTILDYEPEHQGEAIAWTNDASGFYTLSESGSMYDAKLRFYKRNKH